MAEILVDSCVVTDLADVNSQWHEWSASTLESLDYKNSFVINSIIYSECSVAYETIEEVEALFILLRFGLKEISREALFLAGKAFVKYRRRGGTKANILPDFFIGAHAAIEGYSLVTRDKGRFSAYFPSVELIIPA
ncbi:MAG: type II toxin-antitoxin system VapC family toxin [Proteobacteria bacterium]|nr:type II toxin-antitoxin system VapC family toxin [Pseudomonadota bacterium]